MNITITEKSDGLWFDARELHRELEVKDRYTDWFKDQIKRGGFIEGEQWYQSDHSLFIMNQRPALAITSEKFMHLSTYITHTTRDAPALVDTSRLVAIAQGLRNLLVELD